MLWYGMFASLRVCLYHRVRLDTEVAVDARIQDLWHRVTMPLTDGQLEEKLIKSGHMLKIEKKVNQSINHTIHTYIHGDLLITSLIFLMTSGSYGHIKREEDRSTKETSN
jgi:hypothetical protein